MKVISESISFSTKGFSDMKDLTADITKKLSDSGLQNGMVNLFVPGSTGELVSFKAISTWKNNISTTKNVSIV